MTFKFASECVAFRSSWPLTRRPVDSCGHLPYLPRAILPRGLEWATISLQPCLYFSVSHSGHALAACSCSVSFHVLRLPRHHTRPFEVLCLPGDHVLYAPESFLVLTLLLCCRVLVALSP
mmetsp:Transcript_5972/g.13586  ORF Transcript_5972/g.13586 Transcript_5972/m.13586 type:complete len:120 (-) Transcript_5972:324-683(-)